MMIPFRLLLRHSMVNHPPTSPGLLRAYLKKTWSILRELIGKGTDCDTSIDSLKVTEIRLTDPLVIADKFNSYFTGIAQSLERKIPHTTTSFEKYIPLTSLESFGLSSTSPEEIIRLGSTMRISQGKGVTIIY